MPRRSSGGLDQVAAEYEATACPRTDLEDIHMTTESRLAELIGDGGRTPAHRAQPQRPGRDRFQAVGARRDRPGRRRARGAAAGAGDARRGACRQRSCPASPTCRPRSRSRSATICWPITRCCGATARASPTRGRGSNECPLGRAALAGTGFPIDRETTAQALGFDRPTANSLDAVSDRDFALDYLAAAAQCALHLSRLAEELVLWASQPFGFVALPTISRPAPRSCRRRTTPTRPSWCAAIRADRRRADRPDGDDEGPAARLFEGHAGRQAAGFEAHGLLGLSLAAMTGMVAEREFRTERMRAAAELGPRHRDRSRRLAGARGGLPFREAHHITGAR